MSDQERPYIGDAQDSAGEIEDISMAWIALDRGDFRAVETIASDLLDRLPDKPATARLGLLHVRGLGRVQDYHRSGSLNVLRSGIDDLRLARTLYLTKIQENSARQVTEALATAMVRLGEQTNDISLLREATSMFEENYGTAGLASFASKEFAVVNAIAVARLRIGTLTGDRNLVRSVANDLRAYLLQDDRTEEMVSITSKNLVAALCENARQHGEKRVYRDLVEQLDQMMETATGPDRRYYLHYRATARIELSSLASDPTLLPEAVSDLEEALTLSADNVSARIELLHSLAQTDFRIAKIEREPSAAKRAVDHIESALALLEPDSRAPDGRRVRLLSDRASYLHAYAVLANDKKCLEQASDCYSQAVDLLAVERAPVLFAQISGRWFYLEYQRCNWAKALSVFEQIEAAWRVVVSDPSLSSEVTDQRSSEMRGQFARAARCHLAMGNIGDAAVILDSGRGLGHVLSLAAIARPRYEEETARRLALELQSLQRTRQSGSNDECRDAWREFLDLRRRLGLDLQVETISAEVLERRVGNGTVLVQLAMVDGWMTAIVLGAGIQPREISLPDAKELVSFLAGEDSNAAWMDEYERFIASDPEDLAEANRIADAWSVCVGGGLDVIGRTLMSPIHAALIGMGVPPETQVVLSPPGELAAMPLAAGDTGNGAAFFERWPTSLVPCTALLKQSADKWQGAFVVVSTAGGGASGETLPFAQQECERIAALFPSPEVSLLVETQATVPNVLRDIESCSVLHIAAHGRFDWASPDRSCVYLTGNEQLFLGRLRSGVRQSIRLVYLSCCESGISGASRVPDEFVGLLPTFLQIGAEAAIGTLWPVYDDAAMVLALRFYETFLGRDGRGETSAAEALAEAQGWLRRVRIDELIEGDYLTLSQVKEIAESRLSNVRRRAGSAKLPRGSDARSPTPQLSHFDQIRPFANPIDWAGYTVVGR